MRTRQAGVSLMGLIIVLILLAVVALFAMKVIPSYMEYRAIKNAIQSIARERPNATPAEIRKSFDARSNIDDFTAVKPNDLDIQKGSISFAYRKEVPLWTGVALCIDYAASTGQ
jgi:Tfp pilus assembly protein PilE